MERDSAFHMFGSNFCEETSVDDWFTVRADDGDGDDDEDDDV